MSSEFGAIQSTDSFFACNSLLRRLKNFDIQGGSAVHVENIISSPPLKTKFQTGVLIFENKKER